MHKLTKNSKNLLNGAGLIINTYGIDKIGFQIWDAFLENLFYELLTLIIRTPKQKLEVEGFLLGIRVF